MKKLTNEQLEALVLKRNAEGLTHTVEVMNNEELAAYRNNCLEAIARQEERIAKATEGGVMEGIAKETKSELEEIVSYIDAKLSEVKQVDTAPVVTITDMKSKGKKIEITFNGQIISRTTKRNYTHVVIANSYTYGQNGKLIDLAFCGRHDLAVKQYHDYKKNNVTLANFYSDEAFRKPENLEEIKDKKIWENLQIVELKGL